MTETQVTNESCGSYDLESVLGRGAMGMVYLARDRRIGRRVALKRIQLSGRHFEDDHASNDFSQRLQREAEICGSLHHPNIVTLYEAGYENGRISFLAFEYVDGPSLLDLLKKARPRALPLDVALRVVRDVLSGLAFAHGKGFVHRDIKPANILIASDGAAKLADFGIARPTDSSLTAAGSVMGTPNYMPPEQVKGLAVSARSDLFSVGIVLFEMLTGQKPFAAGDISAVLNNIVRQPTPSLVECNPDVPLRYEAFVQRLTAKSPDDRFASAGAALEELHRLEKSPQPVTVPLESAEAVGSSQIDDQSADALVQTHRSVLRRSIVPAIFLPIVVSALLATFVPVYLIWHRIDPTPTAEISSAQLSEFASKRERLKTAEALFQEGKYDESLAAYEAYLARYPYAIAARHGAEKVRAAQGGQQVQSKPRSTPNQSPPSLKDRLKHLFRRN